MGFPYLAKPTLRLNPLTQAHVGSVPVSCLLDFSRTSSAAYINWLEGLASFHIYLFVCSFSF
ncbi:hypothetical protein ACRRTK_009032 [Alexandromys fortis]